MTANAWTIALLVVEQGWSPMALALLDAFTADLIKASARPHHPGCRCPRA